MTLNLYVTPTEVKAAMPQAIRTTTTTYDQMLLQLANMASRFVDRYCWRVFYPVLATRYFDGKGKTEISVGDLLSLTSVEISEDDGITYSAVTIDVDFRLTRWGDFNDPRSWRHLAIDPNGSETAWPEGMRSVRVIGVWAYADDRATAWENSTDTVEDNPLTAGAVEVTVKDADGADQLGLTPRFQAGQLLRIESEFTYCSATNITTNKLTVARAQNGTTAAEHVQNKQIDIWRPPEPIKRVAAIRAVRALERGLQGYGDARATAEIGQLIYSRALDPEERVLLEPYRIVRAG